MARDSSTLRATESSLRVQPLAEIDPAPVAYPRRSMHAAFRRPLVLSALAAVVVASVAASAPAGAVADPSSTVFINELHYDNIGTDAGEAVEIAAPAGTDLTGWTVVLYNGNGGAVYDTDALTRRRRRPRRRLRHGRAHVPSQRDPERSARRAGPRRSGGCGGAVPQLRGHVHRGRRSCQWPDVDRHRRRPSRHRAGRFVAGADRAPAHVRLFTWTATAADSFGVGQSRPDVLDVGPAEPVATCPARVDDAGRHGGLAPTCRRPTPTARSSRSPSPRGPVEGITLTDHGDGTATLDVAATTPPTSFAVEIEFTTDDEPDRDVHRQGVGPRDHADLRGPGQRRRRAHEPGKTSSSRPWSRRCSRARTCSTASSSRRRTPTPTSTRTRPKASSCSAARAAPPISQPATSWRSAGPSTSHSSMTQIGAPASLASVTIALERQRPARGGRGRRSRRLARRAVLRRSRRSRAWSRRSRPPRGQRVLRAGTVRSARADRRGRAVPVHPRQRAERRTGYTSVPGRPGDPAHLPRRRQQRPERRHRRAARRAVSVPDDGSALDNRFRVGDSIDGPDGCPGAGRSARGGSARSPDVDYSFAADNPAPEAPQDVGGTLKVATFNVLNFFTTIDTTSSNDRTVRSVGHARLPWRRLGRRAGTPAGQDRRRARRDGRRRGRADRDPERRRRFDAGDLVDALNATSGHR